jgi:hypothetical protein
MSAARHTGDWARRRRVPARVAALALPLLSACSSSSSVEYATDAYPSQSLVDLLKSSNNSPPPAQGVAPPAPAPIAASSPPPTSAAPPAREPPPIAAAAAPSPPPPPAATPAEQVDPVAAAFPSVSLIDLITGARKPDSQ